MTKLSILGGLLLCLMACTSNSADPLDAYLSTRLAIANITEIQQHTKLVARKHQPTSENLRTHHNIRQTAQRFQQTNQAVLVPLRVWLDQTACTAPPLLPDSIQQIYRQFFEDLYSHPPKGSYFFLQSKKKDILASLQRKYLDPLDSLYTTVDWERLSPSKHHLLAQCYYHRVNNAAFALLKFIYYYKQDTDIYYNHETAFAWSEVLTPKQHQSYPIQIAVGGDRPAPFEFLGLQLDDAPFSAARTVPISKHPIGLQTHRVTALHRNRLTAQVDTSHQVFAFFIQPSSIH